MQEMNTWLTSDLKSEIRLLFEPKYGRRIDDAEVAKLATNLTEYMETVIKWNMKYEQTAIGSHTPISKT